MIYTIHGVSYDMSATVTKSYIGSVRCIVIVQEHSNPTGQLLFTFDRPRHNALDSEIEMYAVNCARRALADYKDLVVAAQAEEHGLGFHKVER